MSSRPTPSRPRAVLAAALALLLFPALGAHAGPAPDPASLGRSLDAWAQPFVQRGLLSGNLLIARRDSVLIERSWGLADASKEVPNAPGIPAGIASITKPLTVLLALQLIEEQKLGYADPLSQWIPGFPQGDSITVQRLLRHQSGIPHRVTTDADEMRPHSAADMVEFARRAPLQFKPGESTSYSSAGYSVLARVLELAGGMSYAELLRTRLFEPLGMSHTFDAGAPPPLPAHAASYVPVLGGVEAAPDQDLSFLVGAGSVFSTPRDLHRLLRADVSGRLGESARQSAVRGGKVNWNGSTNGYRAFAAYDTTTGYALIFVGNLHCGAVDELRSAVERLLAGEAPEPPTLPPARAAEVDPGLLRSYEGLYDIAGNPRLAVRATQSGLEANSWALVATSDSTFFSLRDFATVKAVGHGAGRIERFDWMLGGRAYPCPRVGDLP